MKKASILLGVFALVMCLAGRVAACDYGQAQQIIVQPQYQQVQRVIVPQYQQVQRVQVQRVIVQQQHYAAQQVQRVIVQPARPRVSLNLRFR